MVFRVYNYTDNDDVKVVDKKGPFQVIEWQRDLSVMPWNAQEAYFSSLMNVRRRQLICELNGKNTVVLQAGATQWTVGDVNATTGVHGVGDLLGKMVRGAVSKDSMIKPEYTGVGQLVCEPTWKNLLLIDMAQYGGSIVLDDGLFLACDGSIRQSLQARSNFSSAIAGNEGLFNLRLDGNGVTVLESPCPMQELIVIDLNNDQLKIDGNYAIAWTSSLKFTVERSGKTLIGSAASGEGLVNVYRGSGRVLLAPTRPATYHA